MEGWKGIGERLVDGWLSGLIRINEDDESRLRFDEELFTTSVLAFAGFYC